MKIQTLIAKEILDSRGRPTVQAAVVLQNGMHAEASVPSGASTGSHEAYEKRDGGERYLGLGVLNAVHMVETEISELLRGLDVRDQGEIDQRMIRADSTENKMRFGSNAVLAVSIACARCAAMASNLPLYKYIGGISAMRMPGVMMNVLNGGAHAGNNLDIQEFMLVPREGMETREAVRMCSEIYYGIKKLIAEQDLSVSVGDEGGFAPNLESDEEALLLLERAAEECGYAPGKDVFFALDIAANEWKHADGYFLPKRKKHMTHQEVKAYILSFTRNHPVISVEDPLHEDDFIGFSELTEALKGRALIVGDDLFVTDRRRIRKGAMSASAVLIKPNQIGTVTEALMAVKTARKFGLRVVASHRSGDTADPFLADFAVGCGADYIKSGAPARAERTEKYNRLMTIADETEGKLPEE